MFHTMATNCACHPSQELVPDSTLLLQALVYCTADVYLHLSTWYVALLSHLFSKAETGAIDLECDVM